MYKKFGIVRFSKSVPIDQWIWHDKLALIFGINMSDGRFLAGLTLTFFVSMRRGYDLPKITSTYSIAVVGLLPVTT